MRQQATKAALRILEGLGIRAEEKDIPDGFVTNEVQTEQYPLGTAKVRTTVCWFDSGTVRIDIDLSLPEDGVLADTFMEHCAAIEKTPKNHHHEYCAGPMYKDYTSELYAKKQTFALSPWHDTFFYIRSEGYTPAEMDEAVGNALKLARQFTDHIADLPGLRYWKGTDPEVVAKAKEIVANARFEDRDSDRETGGHWMVDRNSFFKGWFYPFNARGRGTFDTVYQSDFAAIGIKGSFEYAVSCILLFDRDYIAKARKACRIVTETHTVRY